MDKGKGPSIKAKINGGGTGSGVMGDDRKQRTKYEGKRLGAMAKDQERWEMDEDKGPSMKARDQG